MADGIGRSILGLMLWLAAMIFIWLSLLEVARIITGHFSLIEIAMILVVGAGAIVGLQPGPRWRTTVRPLIAFRHLLPIRRISVLAFRISVIPYVARR